jgi:hypothetical protein
MRFSVLACAALLCGCGEHTTTITGTGCFFMCDGVNAPVAYAVSPDSSRILPGDTVTHYSWDCTTGGFSCGLAANVVSHWLISHGSAVELLPGHAAAVSPAAAVLVRAVAAGESRITATSIANASLTQTVRVSVVDSSEVTIVDISSAFIESDAQPVGTSRLVPVQLRTSSGAAVRGRATSWVVSDSSIVTLSPLQFAYGRESRQVMAKKPGTVEIRAYFRDVVGVLRLTVR